MRRARFLAALILAAAMPAMAATAQIVTSGPAPNTLLELYTSEGCNSCPPADRWLAELVSSEALWDQVVPVAFHVTYWDALGWVDELAAPSHDLRQRRLARANRSGVYTPGVFRDGLEFRRWRRGDAAATGREGRAAGGELELTLGADRFDATYHPPRAAAEGLRLHVAWLRGASSDVRRGENRGRRLRHEFAVAHLHSQRLERAADGSWHAQGTVTRPSVTDSPAVAVWVEDAQGRVLQAAGAWLDAVSGPHTAPPVTLR